MENIVDKTQVESVKIYFIEPIQLISVVIDTLIKLNFEAYSIDGAYKNKLISVLKTNPRNVIYICVLGDASVAEWLHYIDDLQAINQSQIQVGAFIFNKMPSETRTQFLERGIATIPFDSLKYNTLQTLKKICVCGHFWYLSGIIHIKGPAHSHPNGYTLTLGIRILVSDKRH